MAHGLGFQIGLGLLCPKNPMLRPHCGLDTLTTLAQNPQRFREMFSIYKKDSALKSLLVLWMHCRAEARDASMFKIFN